MNWCYRFAVGLLLLLLCQDNLLAQRLLRQPVSLQLENVTPAQAIEAIREAHAIHFYAPYDQLPASTFSASWEATPLAEVLEELLADTDWSFLAYRDQAIAILPRWQVQAQHRYREQFFAALEGRLRVLERRLARRLIARVEAQQHPALHIAPM